MLTLAGADGNPKDHGVCTLLRGRGCYHFRLFVFVAVYYLAPPLGLSTVYWLLEMTGDDVQFVCIFTF